MPAEIAAIRARVFPEEVWVKCADLDVDFIARFQTVSRECLNSKVGAKLGLLLCDVV